VVKDARALMKRAPKTRGGEGVQRLLVERGLTRSEGTRSASHWFAMVFCSEGRPMPNGLIVLYIVYCAVCSGIGLLLHLDPEDDSPRLFIATAPVSLIGGFLAFLLVLRTNSSYDRWWEGRKVWGMVVNRTRDLSRQAIGWVDDPAVAEYLCRWCIAFAVSLKEHLRGLKVNDNELEGILPEVEADRIREVQHAPNYVLEHMTELLRLARKTGALSDYQAMTLDANITSFHDSLGKCERILKTPMPFAYVVHLRSFATIWLLALPWALLDGLRWGVIPACTIIAYCILGLEVIGWEIENPFGHDYNDLPLDVICVTIRTNILEILARYQQHQEEDEGVALVVGDGEPVMVTTSRKSFEQFEEPVMTDAPLLAGQVVRRKCIDEPHSVPSTRL